MSEKSTNPKQVPAPKQAGSTTIPVEPEHVAVDPKRLSRFVAQAADIEFLPIECAEAATSGNPSSPTPAEPAGAAPNSPDDEEAFSDPLADVPALGPVTDRFEIQPGDIEFITVGSVEVVIHEADSEDAGDNPEYRSS